MSKNLVTQRKNKDAGAYDGDDDHLVRVAPPTAQLGRAHLRQGRPRQLTFGN